MEGNDMKTKMPTEASTLVLNQHHKDSTLIQSVKSLFLTGQKVYGCTD